MHGNSTKSIDNLMEFASHSSDPANNKKKGT